MRRFSLIILIASSSAMIFSCKNSQAPCEPVKQELIPTEVAVAPMDPGQKSFGSGSRDTTGMAERRRRMMAEQSTIRTVHFNDLSMSDPYIYPDPVSRTYYLTSTGGRLYKSKDLVMWEGPYEIMDLTGTPYEGSRSCAAAEIHKIGDYYYFAGTYGSRELVDVVPRRRNVQHTQTYLLRADNPEGPYTPFSVTPDYDYQPHDWDCIDGTLYEEDGHVYFCFVHEWTQLIDGTMDYVELSSDLTQTISERPVTMFRASENPAVGEMNTLGEATFGLKLCGWVTDGPEFFRTQTGKLGMLWASWGVERYEQLVCYSESGTIAGPWIQEPEPFLANNSGHGMLFRTFDGELRYICHHQEGNDGPRKPQLWEADDSGDKLVLGKRINL
ncbi:MAG: family 43 glycosylhydrolase [Bacteroidales bacterium]|nr:family 43 glycosylhydrolase [Bacteroidales bacterium]